MKLDEWRTRDFVEFEEKHLKIGTLVYGPPLRGSSGHVSLIVKTWPWIEVCNILFDGVRKDPICEYNTYGTCQELKDSLFYDIAIIQLPEK